MDETMICFTCKETITCGDFLQLGEKTFHTKHFWCFTCKTLLENEDFSEHDDKVFCEKHYLEAVNAPKCDKCLEFLSGEYCIIQNKKFHPDCFKCDYCKRTFPKDEYYKSEKKYLCGLCFSKFKAEICEKCNKGIIDQVWNAFGKSFHFDCLVCLKCGGNFDENGYITIDNQPFHETCIAVYCAECEELITEEYFDVDSESVHEKCLEAFQKRDKSNKKANKNELKEAEMKEKLEKNKKEQEFKEQKRKKDLIEMEEILKKKETLAQKAKKEEKPQNEPKVIVDKISTQYIEKKSTSPTPQKKGPPNFASFMKNLKGKNTDVLITNETTVAETSIISTSSSIEKKTEAKIKIPPPPTKSAEINEKPVIVEEKGIDKPKISTIIQKSAELNPTEQEQKNSLSHNIEEESKEKNKDKDKIQEKEKNTISEITEKEITIEKTNIENINVQTKTEEISEGKKESNDEIYEKKNKIGQVKIEKKFIKMHNRFKKL